VCVAADDNVMLCAKRARDEEAVRVRDVAAAAVMSMVVMNSTREHQQR
jgi:hypothetical protein